MNDEPFIDRRVGDAGLFLAIWNKFNPYVRKIYYRGTNETIYVGDNGLKYLAVRK